MIHADAATNASAACPASGVVAVTPSIRSDGPAASIAPAGTPKATLGKLETDIKLALASADVRGKLEALRMEIRSGDAEEMRALLADDIAKWGRLVKEKNIRIAH